MFGMPLTTEYDTKFQLLGIPVRINPFFWVMAAVLGWQDNSGPQVVIWVACVFVSILVHEFGHALTTVKAFHQRPSVILYYMGGLCVSDGQQHHLWRRAWVIIMGPVAGFLLFGLVISLGSWLLGVAYIPFYGGIHVHDYPRWFTTLPEGISQAILAAYFFLIYINLFWGLFNLLPIFPLDGGQLAQVFLTMHNRREGAIRCHAVSLVVAGLLAVYLFSKESYYNAFFIASLAAMNLQLYQAARMQKGSFSQFEDDDDWWRR
jgi:stage IV sporulation protein FB